MSRSSRSRDKSWSFVPWYNTGDLYLPQEDPYQNLWQMSTTDSRRSGSSRKYYDGASLSSYSHQGSTYAYDNYAYIDSGYVSSMKSFKTGSYSLEGGRKFRSHQRKKRCAIIAVILCVLALIAVAIGISIYLNDQKPLVKTTESTTQAPTTEVTTQAATATTTQATTTYTAPLLPVYGGNLKLNRTWDPNLNDQTSTEYQNLKNTMEDALDATYSNYSENFNYSVVTGFEQGSIDIKYILVFIVVTASPEEIQNALVVAISSGQNNSPVTAVLAEAIPESVVIEQQTAAPPTTTASATTTSTTAATTTVSTTTTPTTTVSTTTTPTTTVSTTTTSTTTVSTTTTPTTTVSTTTTPTTSSSAVTSTATPVDSTTTSTLTTPSTTPTTIASSPKTSTSETSASSPKLSTTVSVSTTATPGTTTPMSTTSTVIQTTTVNPCTDVDSLETVALRCVGKYTLQITDAKNLTEFCGVMDLILSCVIIDVYNQTKVTCTEQDGNHLIETYGDTIKTLLSLPYNPKDCLVTVSTTAVTPSMTTPPAQPCQNMSLVDVVAPPCLTASLINNLTNAGSETEFCSAIQMYGICIKSRMFTTYGLVCTEDDMMYWLKVSAEDIKSQLSTKYDPLICLVTSSTTAPSSTTPTISNCSDVSWLKQQMDENCGSAMEMFSRTRDQQDRCRIYTDLLGCLHVNWDLKNIKCSITSVAETIATEGKFSMLVPSAPNFNASICYNGTIPLPVTTPLVSPYCKQPDVVRFVSSYDCHANLSFTAEANPVTLCRFYQMKLGCVIYNLREIIAAEKCSLDDTRHTFDEYLSQNMPNIGMSINLTTCHSIPTNTCSSFMYNDIEYGYSCGRLLGNGIGIPVLRDTPGLLCNVTGIAYECVYRGSKDHHNLVCDKYQMAKDIVPWLQAVQALYIPDSSDSVVIDYNTCLEKAANKTDFGEGKQEEDSQALVLYGAPCLEPLSQISLSDYLVCSIVEQSIPCWQNALYESTGDTYDNKAIKDAIGKEIPLLKTITGKNLTSCVNNTDGTCFPFTQIATDHNLGSAAGNCFGFYGLLEVFNTTSPVINNTQACGVFDHGVSCMRKNISQYGFSCSFEQMREIMILYITAANEALNRKPSHDIAKCPVMDETSFCTDDLSFKTTVIVANCSAALQFGGTNPSDSCSKYISFRDCLYSAIVYNTASPAYFHCTTQEAKSLIKNNIDWIEESTKSNVNRSCLDIVDPCFSPASLETDRDLAGASASCFGYFQYLIDLNMLTPSGQQINSSQACRVFDHGVSCMSKTIAPFGYSCSHASVRLTMSTAYSYYLTAINKASLFDPASCRVSAEGNFCSDNLTFTTTTLVATCHTNLEGGDSDPVGYCQSSFEGAFKTCLYTTYGNPVSPSYFRCSHEDVDKLIRSNIKWLQQFVKSGVNLTYCINLKVLSLSMELNTTFHPDLYNKSSTLYQDFTKNITEGLEGLLPNSEVKINEFRPGSVIVHLEVTSFSQIFTVDVIGQTLNSSAPTSLPPLRHYIPGSLLQLQDVTPSVTPPTVNPSCRNMSIVDVVSPPCLTANLTNTILNANSQTEYCSALEMYGICVRNKMFTTYGWTCTEDDMMYWLRVSAEEVKNAFPKYDPLICLSTEQTTVPVPTTPPISSCSDVSWLKQQMDEYCGSAMEMFSRTHDQQDRCRIYTDVLGCLHVNWDLRSISCSITSVAKVITAVEFSKFVPSASNFNSSICYDGMIPLPVTTPLVAPYCKQPDVVTYAARYDCHANLSFTAGANDETICRFYQMKLGCVMHSLREIRAAEKCSLDDTRHTFDKYLSRNMPDIGMSINLTTCHSIPTNTCSSFMYNDIEYGYSCGRLLGNGIGIPVLRDTPGLLCNVTGIAYECVYRGSKDHHNLVCDKYQMAKDIVPWLQAVQALYIPDSSDSVVIDYNTCLEKAANKTDFGEGKQEEDSQALVLYGAPCLEPLSQISLSDYLVCSIVEQSIPCWQNALYESTGDTYDNKAIKDAIGKEIPLLKTITGKNLTSCVNNTDGTCFPFTQIATDHNLGSAAGNCFGFYGLLEVFNTTSPVINNTQACGVFDHGVSCMRKNISQYGFSCSFEQMREIMILYITAANEALNRKPLHDIAKCPVMDETSFCTDDLSFKTVVIVANCSAALQFGGTDPSDSCSKYISFRDCLYSAIVYNTASPAYFRCTTQEANSLIKNNIDWIEESTKSNVNRSCLDIVDPCFSPASLETDKDLAGASASCFGYFQYLIELNMLTPSGQQINSSQACRVFDHGVSCMSKTIAPFGYSCSHASVRMTMSTAYSYYLTAINKASLFDPGSCQVMDETSFCTDDLSFTTTVIIANCSAALQFGGTDPSDSCSKYISFRDCLYSAIVYNTDSPAYFRCTTQEVKSLIKNNIDWIEESTKSNVNRSCLDIVDPCFSPASLETDKDLAGASASCFGYFQYLIGLNMLMPSGQQINSSQACRVFDHGVSCMSKTIAPFGYSCSHASVRMTMSTAYSYYLTSINKSSLFDPASCRVSAEGNFCSDNLTFTTTTLVSTCHTNLESGDSDPVGYCQSSFEDAFKTCLYKTYGDPVSPSYFRCSHEDIDKLIRSNIKWLQQFVKSGVNLTYCIHLKVLSLSMELNTTFHPDLYNKSSTLYQDFAKNITEGLEGLLPNSEVKINEFGPGSVIVHFEVTSFSQIFTVDVIGQTLNSSAPTSLPPLRHYIPGSLLQLQDVTPSVTPPTVNPSCRNMSIVDVVSPPCLTANLTNTILNANSQTEYCSALEMYGICVRNKMFTTYGWTCTEDDMMYWLRVSAEEVKNAFPKYDPLICLSTEQTTVPVPTTPPISSCSDVSWLKQQMDEYCGSAMEMFSRTHDQQDRCRIYTDVLGCLHVNWDLRSINCSITSVAKVITAVEFSKFVPSASNFNSSICYNGTIPLPVTTPLVAPYCKQPDVVTYAARYDCHANLSFTAGANDETICRFYQMKLGCVMYSLREIRAAEKCSLDDTRHAFDKYLSRNMPDIGMSINLTMCHSIPTNTCSTIMYNDTEYGIACTGLVGIGMTIPVLRDTPELLCNVTGIAFECLYRVSKERHNLVCDKYQMAKDIVPWFQAVQAFSTPDPSDSVTIDFNTCLEKAANKTDFGEGKQEEDSQALVLYGASCLSVFSQTPQDPNTNTCSYLEHFIPCWQRSIYEFTGIQYDYTAIRSLTVKEIPLIKAITGKDLSACVNHTECFPITSNETAVIFQKASEGCLGYYGILEHFNTSSPVVKINNTQACRVFDHGVSCLRKNISNYGGSCSFEQMRETVKTFFANVSLLHDVNNCPVSAEVNFCDDNLTFTTSAIVSSCYTLLAIGDTDTLAYCTSNFEGFKGCMYNAMSLFTSPSYYQCSHGDVDKLIRNNIKWLQQFVLHGANLTQCINLKVLSLSMKLNTTFHPDLYNASSTRYSDFAKNITEGMETIFKGSEIKITGFMEGSVIVYFNITTVSTNLTVNIVMQTLDSSATTSPPPLNLYIRGSLVQSRDVTLPVGLCRNMSIVNSFNSTCLTANISVTLMNTTSQFEYCSVLGMYGACISRHIAEKYLEVCSQDDMIYWLVESAPNLRNLSRIYDPLSCIPQTTVSPHTTQAYAQCNDADWIQQQMGAHCSAALDIFNRTQSQDDRCRIYTDTLGCLVVSWGMRQINCSINDVARVIAAKDFSMFVSTASTFNASLCYSGSGGLPTAAPLTGNLCEHPNVIAYHSLYTCPTNFTMDQHSTNETLCRKYQIQLTCVDNEMRMSNCSFNQMKKTFDMHLAENMPHIGGSVDVKFCDGLPNNTCSSFMYGDRRLLYRCGVYYVLGALFKGLNTPPNVCIPMGESLECLYRDSVQKNLTCSKEELADSSVMWLQSLHTLTKGYEPSTPNISKQNYTSCLNETIKQADFGNGTQAEDHRALVLMGLNCMADKFHNGVNCGDIPGIMSCWQNTHQSLVGYVYDITVYATALQKEVMFIKDYLKYDLTPCFVK